MRRRRLQLTLPHAPLHEVHRQLVDGHHDCRVGDLPDELGGQAPVQAPAALLTGHGEDRLPERAVLVALLAEAGARHLWKLKKSWTE